MNNVLTTNILIDSRSSQPPKESRSHAEVMRDFKKNPSSRETSSLRIAQPAERLEALNLLFQNPVGGERRRMLNWAVSLAKNNPKAFAGLFVFGPREEIEAAIWLYQLPGRQLNVWVPSFSAGVGDHDRQDFLRQVAARVINSPADLAWSTVNPDAVTAMSQLNSLGLHEVAELTRMVWPACELKSDEDHNLDFVPYEHAKHQQRLLSILRRCDKDSLDCRKLHGIRKTADILEGHRFRESLTPSNWLIVQDEGRDVGCVLLSRHKTQSEFEVVYLAIVPEMRGRRFGRAIVRVAQKICFEAGAEHLILTCDGCNTPAWNLYQSCGFEPNGTWKLFARRLTGEPNSR